MSLGKYDVFVCLNFILNLFFNLLNYLNFGFDKTFTKWIWDRDLNFTSEYDIKFVSLISLVINCFTRFTEQILAVVSDFHQFLIVHWSSLFEKS